MTPYWDPDCECRSHTLFEGKLQRNRITGTFSTGSESSYRPIVWVSGAPRGANHDVTIRKGST